MPCPPSSILRSWKTIACWCFSLAAARAATPSDIDSHEVNKDQSITFRYYGPGVTKVTVSLDYSHHPVPMLPGPGGIWSLQTQPLASGLHMYSMAVDGMAINDPLNPVTEHNLVYVGNETWVNGPTPELWDNEAVPHGVVHHHQYRSELISGLADSNEDYYVYTPPGYDTSSDRRYPVLYLLHGWGSLADSWVHEGQANLILDNLFAQGKVRPMVLVMPQGYGEMSFVRSGLKVWTDETKISSNLNAFEMALLQEILPQVQSGYQVSRNRADRAIAGLSMGGGESVVIGLRHPDLFAWIGGFSSAVAYQNFNAPLPHLDRQTGDSLQLLWLSCGTSDELITAQRRLAAWLAANRIQAKTVEQPGIHNWPVWRDSLIHFVPLLFRGAKG